MRTDESSEFAPKGFAVNDNKAICHDNIISLRAWPRALVYWELVWH